MSNYHVQLHKENSDKTKTKLYPKTTANDVSVDNSTNQNVSDCNDMQEVIDKMGDMAFKNSDGYATKEDIKGISISTDGHVEGEILIADGNGGIAFMTLTNAESLTY